MLGAIRIRISILQHLNKSEVSTIAVNPLRETAMPYMGLPIDIFAVIICGIDYHKMRCRLK